MALPAPVVWHLQRPGTRPPVCSSQGRFKKASRPTLCACSSPAERPPPQPSLSQEAPAETNPGLRPGGQGNDLALFAEEPGSGGLDPPLPSLPRSVEEVSWWESQAGSAEGSGAANRIEPAGPGGAPEGHGGALTREQRLLGQADHPERPDGSQAGARAGGGEEAATPVGAAPDSSAARGAGSGAGAASALGALSVPEPPPPPLLPRSVEEVCWWHSQPAQEPRPEAPAEQHPSPGEGPAEAADGSGDLSEASAEGEAGAPGAPAGNGDGEPAGQEVRGPAGRGTGPQEAAEERDRAFVGGLGAAALGGGSSPGGSEPPGAEGGAAPERDLVEAPGAEVVAGESADAEGRSDSQGHETGAAEPGGPAAVEGAGPLGTAERSAEAPGTRGPAGSEGLRADVGSQTSDGVPVALEAETETRKGPRGSAAQADGSSMDAGTDAGDVAATRWGQLGGEGAAVISGFVELGRASLPEGLDAEGVPDPSPDRAATGEPSGEDVAATAAADDAAPDATPGGLETAATQGGGEMLPSEADAEAAAAEYGGMVGEGSGGPHGDGLSGEPSPGTVQARYKPSDPLFRPPQRTDLVSFLPAGAWQKQLERAVLDRDSEVEDQVMVPISMDRDDLEEQILHQWVVSCRRKLFPSHPFLLAYEWQAGNNEMVFKGDVMLWNGSTEILTVELKTNKAPEVSDQTIENLRNRKVESQALKGEVFAYHFLEQRPQVLALRIALAVTGALPHVKGVSITNNFTEQHQPHLSEEERELLREGFQGFRSLAAPPSAALPSGAGRHGMAAGSWPFPTNLGGCQVQGCHRYARDQVGG